LTDVARHRSLPPGRKVSPRDPAVTDRTTPPESLDPQDWDQARTLAHRMIDDAIDHLQGLRDRAPWREMPAEVRASLGQRLPDRPQSAEAVYQDFLHLVRPYPMGNIHPRFFAWYMGGSNLTGALADFLAAIDGSNLGGGNTAPALVDRQVTGWLRDLMGFPAGSGATLTSGGSVANLIGHAVMRHARAGVDVRAQGVRAMPRPLRVYASDQVHSCHQKALEVLGLGSQALRLIPTGPDFRLDLAALARAVEEDRAQGWQPASVIGTAGTVNTGAVDDLSAIADFCQAQGLWFHVDGCIGAFLRLSPDHAALVAGLDRADSLALDPHKWLHAPFDVGCALIRDGDLQRRAFTLHPEYLEVQARGMAGAEFLFDYGIDLSRSFKALKVWMALKEFGPARHGRLIAQSVDCAAHLAAQVAASNDMELMAPQVINIACFRFNPGGLDEAGLKALNTEIMLRLQEEGIAFPTDTTLGGRHSLRVATVNHRTQRQDMDVLLAETRRIGRSLMRA
jgi:aromatic-L-amino-acid/L-tryptophan decarboxylase